MGHMKEWNDETLALPLKNKFAVDDMVIVRVSDAE